MMKLALSFLMLGFAALTMAQQEKASLKAISDASSSFSANLLKTLAKDKKENLVISPLSAHVLLSMVYYGADGNTAKEMRESLHLPEDNSLGKDGFQNLMQHLNSVQNVTLEMANTMYLGKGLKLKPDFKQVANSNFRSDAAELDFTQKEEAAKTINNWADEKTHHKISKLVEPDDISDDVRAMLMNAIYFKGNWAKKFKKEDTQPRPFYLDEQNQVNVTTMFLKSKFVYGEISDLDAKFVELPYQNKDLKMVIVVPNEINGLGKIIDNVEKVDEAVSKSGWERDVFLYLPTFKIESSTNLNEPLQKMGMKDMFTQRANFSGISEEPLSVSKVFQKAMIEVNEEGSEAAAVTATIMVLKLGVFHELPIYIHADRPFYYLIKTPLAVMFRGIVHNP